MPQKIVEYLQYRFTDEELLEIARLNARTQSEKRALENQKAQITKQLAGEIAAKDADLQKFSEFVSNGFEYRNVECSVLLDCPKKGHATIYRIDNGETVRTRLMTQEELQMPLEGLES